MESKLMDVQKLNTILMLLAGLGLIVGIGIKLLKSKYGKY